MQYFPCHGRMDWFMLDLDNAITPANSVGVVTYLEMKKPLTFRVSPTEVFDTKN
jgi:hypothetical protein